MSKIFREKENCMSVTWTNKMKSVRNKSMWTDFSVGRKKSGLHLLVGGDVGSPDTLLLL